MQTPLNIQVIGQHVHQPAASQRAAPQQSQQKRGAQDTLR